MFDLNLGHISKIGLTSRWATPLNGLAAAPSFARARCGSDFSDLFDVQEFAAERLAEDHEVFETDGLSLEPKTHLHVDGFIGLNLSRYTEPSLPKQPLVAFLVESKENHQWLSI